MNFKELYIFLLVLFFREVLGLSQQNSANVERFSIYSPPSSWTCAAPSITNTPIGVEHVLLLMKPLWHIIVIQSP